MKYLLIILTLVLTIYSQSFDYGSFAGFYNKARNCPDYTVYSLTKEQVELAELSK